MSDVLHDAGATANPPADDDLTATRAVLLPPTDQAISRTREWLYGQQHRDGFWCGELEGDTILESEYILLLAWLGRVRSELALRAARYLESKQLDGGGWCLFPGGPPDVSVSVKAYFALKLTGHSADTEPMRRAREAILSCGGADAVNSFTRFYLALLGQIPYELCPAVPPEMVLLPRWLPINIYRISAWSRTIFVPLSLVWALRPVREVGERAGIRELFVRQPRNWPRLRSPGSRSRTAIFSWERTFRWIDSALKWCERNRLRPARGWAMRRATAWILDRLPHSDGLGAIFPPIIWSTIALKCRGFTDDSPEVVDCLSALEKLMIADGDRLRLQPCESPVWDTALTIRALASSRTERCGQGQHRDGAFAAEARAVEWLLCKEVRQHGDWSMNVRAEPAGWFFEHHNEFYPDVDDTIMVMMALSEVSQAANASQGQKQEGGGPEGAHRTQFPDGTSVAADFADARHFLALPTTLAISSLSPQSSSFLFSQFDAIYAANQRGLQWLLAMQNRDGGWGAFDKDNDFELLCQVPFADHNAMIDPSTPDITARVLEGLAQSGYSITDPRIAKAVAYLRRTQEADGSWYGRWGVNYIYGTWQVLTGLRRVGVPSQDPAISRGAQWLIDHQQPTGGWGESPESYVDPRRGISTPTASQTAWSILGLVECGKCAHPATVNGVRFLVERQTPNGTWIEHQFTGTGFPQVFYLRYHMYPIYFPLLALSRWRRAVTARESDNRSVAND